MPTPHSCRESPPIPGIDPLKLRIHDTSDAAKLLGLPGETARKLHPRFCFRRHLRLDLDLRPIRQMDARKQLDRVVVDDGGDADGAESSTQRARAARLPLATPSAYASSATNLACSK